MRPNHGDVLRSLLSLTKHRPEVPPEPVEGGRSKRWLILAIVVISLLAASGYAGQFNKAPAVTAPNSSKEFVRRNGDKLVVGQDDREIRLRGINFNNLHWESEGSLIITSDHHSEIDFQRVADMGMNVIRFNLSYVVFEDDDAPYVYKQAGWDWLDQNINWAKKYGVYLILDMHVPQGGYQGGMDEGFALWDDMENQNRLKALWRAIAERYKDEPTIAAWDLINEPTPSQNQEQWETLAQELIDEIRTVDSNHLIIIETVCCDGNISLFLVGDENVMYDFHFYHPDEYAQQYAYFTGQGDGGTYPDPAVAVFPPEFDWEGAIQNPSVPAGDSQWAFYEGTLHQITDPRIIAGTPAFNCDASAGMVYFDDFVVSEYDMNQDLVRRILSVDVEYAEDASDLSGGIDPYISATSWWDFWSEDGSGSYAVADTAHQGSTSLSITPGAGATSLSNGRLMFGIKQGYHYAISGWMRGVGVRDANCQITVEFAEMPAGQEIVWRDRNYLDSQLLRGLEFGRVNNVPMNIGESGLTTGCFEDDKGGLIWVQDMLELLDQYEVHFQYYDYHSHDFGLYRNREGLPDPASANQELIDLFAQFLRAGKESPFGMGIYLYRYLDNPDLMEAIATLAEDAEVFWDREEFGWEGTGSEGDQDFTSHDTMVDIAERHGINVYGLVVEYEDLDTVSPYANEHFEAFANFVSTLVDRYRGKINYWEIWNEPDISEYWKPEPNAFNYFQLLKHAYLKAKATDPSVKIIGLAVDSGSLEFIEEVFQYGGLDYMDIVAVHPYAYPAPIETSFQFEAIGQIKNLMKRYGTEKPIWVTEVGYPTHEGEGGVTEERQAELLARTYLVLISSGIEAITWYDFIDDGTDPHDREQNFGIIKNDLTPKKAYRAYQTMTRLMEGHEFSEELNVQAQIKALLFENNEGKRILALWTFGDVSEEGKPIALVINGQIDNIVDIYGGEIPYTTSGNSVRLLVSSSPIYLQGNFEVLGWEPAGFGGAGNFLSVHFDPTQPGVVYAASDVAGVLHSTDFGNSWEIRSAGLGNYEVASFAVDPFDPNTLYAGVGAVRVSDRAGIYISRDAGRTWQHLPATSANNITFRKYRTANAIAPHPAQPGVLLSGSRENGIWRSTDRGVTWTHVYTAPLTSAPLTDIEGSVLDDLPSPHPAPVSVTAFDSINTNVAYAGLDGFGVVKSTDDGLTWQPINDGLPTQATVKHLAVGGGGVLYAALGTAGVYKSTDGGGQWQPVNTSLTFLPDHWISSVAVHPDNPNTAYLTVVSYDYPNIWKTTDGGATWVPRWDAANVTRDPTDNPTRVWTGKWPNLSWHIALDPANPNRLFYVDFWGIHRSDDAGEHWTEKVAGAQNTCVTGVVADTDHPAGQPDTLYATHMDAGLLQSTDQGESWTTVLPPAGDFNAIESLAGHYWNFAIARVGDTKYYYTTADAWGYDYSRLLRSTDGVNWTTVFSSTHPAGTWMDGAMLGLAVDPSRPSTVYTSQDGGRVWKSNNNGEPGTWAPTAGQPGGNSFTYALVADDAGRVFAGTLLDGLWRSTDGGASWHQVLESEGTIFELVAASDVVYATGLTNLFRSTDGGDSWVQLTNFSPPSDPDGVSDGARSIAVDPYDPSHILFGRDDTWHSADAGPGIVESFDGGNSWTLRNAGLGLHSVSALAIGSDGTLYAGTWCGGLWRLNLRPPASQCLSDANANGRVDVVDLITTARTPACQAYLPLLANSWRQPWPP